MAIRSHRNSEATRRDFLKTAALFAGGISLLDLPVRPRPATAALPSSKHLTIERIERTTIRNPFRQVPGRNMARELPHWDVSEIVEVYLKSGPVGIGETLLYYTWGRTEDDDVRRALGQNAAELMWDDSLGAGLQMALFDVVARSAEVPVHALLGRKTHDRTPLSWWNIDTIVEDMVLECQEAMKQGYRAYKTKGRPWFDIWAQVEAAAKVVPESFKIDMDFNNTLLDAERGIPICRDLEKYPHIDIYETPIPQGDIAGNQAIRQATRVAIAMHYGTPNPRVAIAQEVCDGFIIGGGASRVMQHGAVAAMANMPFWLQLVGTDITAAFSLHFGGVLSHATWPAVNCHQLYQHSLLTEPIKIKDGFAAVPDRPGLGFELNRDAVEKLRIPKPTRRFDPPRLVEVSWTNGRKLYLANTRVNFVLNAFLRDGMPFYERGVQTRLLANDGSQSWLDLYEKARKGPHFVK